MNRTQLKVMLHEGEGRRKKPYKDTVGKLTIGVGRNLDDVGLRDNEIDLMLENDIDAVEKDLDRALPWWRSMNDRRQLVLADMCFNLGITKLLKFENTLAAMRVGNYAKAAEGMKASLWARQVKGRADKLIKMMEPTNA